MSRVNDLIGSWGADVTCDTPRDARRMQQLVTLAQQLEADALAWANDYRALQRTEIAMFHWLLSEMSHQCYGPNCGYTLDRLLPGESAWDAVHNAYIKDQEKEDAA